MNTLIFNNNLTQKQAFDFKANLLNQVSQNQTLMVDLTEVKEADLVGVNALATAHLNAMEKNHLVKFKIKKESEIENLLKVCKFNKILNLVY